MAEKIWHKELQVSNMGDFKVRDVISLELPGEQWPQLAYVTETRGHTMTIKGVNGLIQSSYVNASQQFAGTMVFPGDKA